MKRNLFLLFAICSLLACANRGNSSQNLVVDNEVKGLHSEVDASQGGIQIKRSGYANIYTDELIKMGLTPEEGADLLKSQIATLKKFILKDFSFIKTQLILSHYMSSCDSIDIGLWADFVSGESDEILTLDLMSDKPCDLKSKEEKILRFYPGSDYDIFQIDYSNVEILKNSIKASVRVSIRKDYPVEGADTEITMFKGGKFLEWIEFESVFSIESYIDNLLIITFPKNYPEIYRNIPELYSKAIRSYKLRLIKGK